MKSFKQFLNAKTRSVKDIAKKHNVSTDHINDQIKKGIEVEKEHTKHSKVAKEIALDHAWEDKDYYTKLKKMEKH